jgi:hypothetical protein
MAIDRPRGVRSGARAASLAAIQAACQPRMHDGMYDRKAPKRLVDDDDAFCVVGRRMFGVDERADAATPCPAR